MNFRHMRRPAGRLFCCLLSLLLAAPLLGAGPADQPARTVISDVLYRADGSPASGKLLISWPAFTSAEAIAQRDIVDEGKFSEGLGKIIDGTVQCLNASAWAKSK